MATIADAFSSGQQAVELAQTSPARLQEARLQEQYRPQQYADAQTEQGLKIAKTKLEIQKLQEVVATEANARPILQGYYADPANSKKPLSQQNEELSNRLAASGNFTMSRQLRQDAVKAAKEESDAENARYKTEDARRDHVRGIVDRVDPNSEESINKGLKEAEDAGFDTSMAKAIAKKVGWPKALDLFSKTLTSHKEKAENIKEAQLAAKIDQDRKSNDLKERSLDLQIQRLGFMMQQGQVKIDAKDKETAEKNKRLGAIIQGRLGKESVKLKETYDKNFREEASQEGKNTLTEKYAEDLEALSDRGKEELATIGIEWGGYVPKTRAERTPSREASGKIQPPKVSNNSIPTVTTQAEFNKLPKGSIYIEDGVQYRKP